MLGIEGLYYSEMKVLKKSVASEERADENFVGRECDCEERKG